MFFLPDRYVPGSDRHKLQETEKVEKIQEVYIQALRDYIQNKYKYPSPLNFGRLMTVLSDLRMLGFLNNKQCYTIAKENKIPDFLSELWDV